MDNSIAVCGESVHQPHGPERFVISRVATDSYKAAAGSRMYMVLETL